jgi:hypothetical protein
MSNFLQKIKKVFDKYGSYFLLSVWQNERVGYGHGDLHRISVFG